jgi:hypothetical protein
MDSRWGSADSDGGTSGREGEAGGFREQRKLAECTPGGEGARVRLPWEILESKGGGQLSTLTMGRRTVAGERWRRRERMVEEDMQLVQDAATIGDGPRSLWGWTADRDGKESTDLGPPALAPRSELVAGAARPTSTMHLDQGLRVQQSNKRLRPARRKLAGAMLRPTYTAVPRVTTTAGAVATSTAAVPCLVVFLRLRQTAALFLYQHPSTVRANKSGAPLGARNLAQRPVVAPNRSPTARK